MEVARAVGCLPVANVQALAETCNRTDGQVPERYLVGIDASPEEIISGDDSNSAIPIIDFGKLLDPRSSSGECAKLGSACQNWGFFLVCNKFAAISTYILLRFFMHPFSMNSANVSVMEQMQLINHGVPHEVTGNLTKDVAEFFKQPLEAKKAYSQQPDSLEGYGQGFVVSKDQKLDWADMMYLQVQPSALRDLRFWPSHPASFRRSVDLYSSETAKLSCRLLEFMSKGVGAEPASLLGLFEGQPAGMRVNYYPPCRQAEQVLGLSPHTDGGGLTLLWQMSDDVQGLQVKKDGKWFAVDVLPDAFVVNVGDALEVLSNGKFRSVEHRAVIHPNKERISVAMFHYPCQDLMLGPLPEFVTKGDKARYRSTSYQDFMKQHYAAKLGGRDHVERLKLE